MKNKIKIDWWIGLLLLGSSLMMFPLIFTVPDDEKWIMIITAIIMAIFILPFFYGYHELTDDAVVTRLGFIKQTIPYEKIKSVRMCSNWLSSYAMTKDRIEIKVYNKSIIRGTTYIGPRDREDFFDELKRRCYNLEEKTNITDY